MSTDSTESEGLPILGEGDPWEMWVAGAWPAPTCHGLPMIYKEGTSRRGNAYRAFFCVKARTCQPMWIPVSGKG